MLKGIQPQHQRCAATGIGIGFTLRGLVIGEEEK